MYYLDKNVVTEIKKQNLDPKSIEELTISNRENHKGEGSSVLNVEDFLNRLGEFEKLKHLRFERYQYITVIDTFITFDPMNFDIIEHVVDYGFDLPFYSILPSLDTFKELEVLEIDFLDNDGVAEVCRRDFAWLVLQEGIEKEMIQELLLCENNEDINFASALVNEHFTMWDWRHSKGEIQFDLIIPPRVAEQKEVVFNAYRESSETQSFDEMDSLSDEEFCVLMPELCDGFEQPTFQYDDQLIDTTYIISCGIWGDEPIDTVFLKEIGAWPLEEDFQEEKCIDNLQENLIWKRYQEKCAELYQLAFWEETRIDSIYQNTPESDQILMEQNIDKTIPISYQKIQRFMWSQRTYYKDMWKVLQPWAVKPRSELFLEQLGKLKQLKKLSISNNYMLDVEALINLIAEELPNLEILEINHCLLFNLPENINQLQKLKVLNLEYNLIWRVPKITLTELKILNIENNPVSSSY